MYKKYLIYTIVIFYIFSSFLSATHIHKKVNTNSSDCKVCIVVKNIQSGDVTSIDESSQNFFIAYELIIEQESLFSFKLHKSYHSQAPPLYS